MLACWTANREVRGSNPDQDRTLIRGVCSICYYDGDYDYIRYDISDDGGGYYDDDYALHSTHGLPAVYAYICSSLYASKSAGHFDKKVTSAKISVLF